MDQLTYLTFLRFIHITCGVFWAGATIYLAGFVAPAVKAIGPDGAKFMAQLGKTNKLPMVMTIAATLNVLAGLLLFWEMSNGFQGSWIVSRHGMILTIGGSLALIAYFEGVFVTRALVLKMNTLGAAITGSGNPPSPEQSQQLAGIRKKIFSANNLVAVLLGLCVVAMSLAKYL